MKRGAGRASATMFPLLLSFSLPFLAPFLFACRAPAHCLQKAFPSVEQPPSELLEAGGVLCEGNTVPLLSLPAGSIQEAAGTLARGSRRHGSPTGWEERRAAEEPSKHDPTPSTVYEAGTQVRW